MSRFVRNGCKYTKKRRHRDIKQIRMPQRGIPIHIIIIQLYYSTTMGLYFGTRAFIIVQATR